MDNEAAAPPVEETSDSKPKMPMDFYFLPQSPPCRSVMLLAKALDIELDMKMVNIMAGDHLTPEFVKMNPQHSLPTLDDEGFVLWESRAILGYLVNQYGSDDSYYPRDPKKKALVDQRLYFDAGTLHQRLFEYFYPVAFTGAEPQPEKLEKVGEALDFLNLFLEGQEYVAGDSLTIADIAIVVSVSNCDVLGVDVSAYPNVSSWYERMKTEIPGYDEINEAGANAIGQVFQSKLS